MTVKELAEKATEIAAEHPDAIVACGDEFGCHLLEDLRLITAGEDFPCDVAYMSLKEDDENVLGNNLPDDDGESIGRALGE